MRPLPRRGHPASDSRSERGAPILVIDEAVAPPLCARIRQAMDAGAPEPAEILGADIGLDTAVRSTTHLDVDPVTLACIEDRLEAQRPAIAAFFGLTPGPREGSSLLRYGAGGFFKPHRDWGEVPSWPAAARRRIAIVLFLTSSTAVDPSGTFAGGTLRLMDDDGMTLREIHPRAGALVAFPASMLHEVTLVTTGVRDTVVDWFYDTEE